MCGVYPEVATYADCHRLQQQHGAWTSNTLCRSDLYPAPRLPGRNSNNISVCTDSVRLQKINRIGQTSQDSRKDSYSIYYRKIMQPWNKFSSHDVGVFQSFFFISQDKCVWDFLTWTITGDSNPNISRPSTGPGGCNVGRLALPMLSCFRISIFSLSQTMLQHLVGETLIKTSPGQFSIVTCKCINWQI